MKTILWIYQSWLLTSNRISKIVLKIAKIKRDELGYKDFYWRDVSVLIVTIFK